VLDVVPEPGRSEQVLDALRAALEAYPLSPRLDIECINQSENVTFLVQDHDTGRRCVLRLHRPGYRTREEIESELAWLAALRRWGVIEVPAVIPTREGSRVHQVQVPGSAGSRFMVLFDYLDGEHLPEDGDLRAPFEELGEVTAQLHRHVREEWSPAAGFKRPTWNFDTTLGDSPFWGSWRDGVGLDDEGLELFERAVAVVAKRLREFGDGSDRFGLVHADLRLANLLFDGERTKVIDFDDCGFSWYLYDLATAVSFIEHRVDLEDLIDHWVRGYERIAPLDRDHRNAIPTFVVLRRILLVAWVGSHQEADIAADLGAGFTRGSYPLIESYLRIRGEG
jgi:Ser/Thr protein kinase RdoA (MazF antagonist)